MAKFPRITSVPSPKEIADANKRAEENTRYVQDLVNSNLGQPVLVIESREDIGGCTGFGGHGYLEMKTHYSLTVPEEKAKINKGSLIIPGRQYAQRSDCRGEWYVRDGAITLDCLTLFNLNNELDDFPLGRAPKGFDDLDQSLKLYAGNRETELFFSFPPIEHEEVRAETSKMNPAQFDDYIRKRGHPDVSYIDALRLFRLEAPAPFKEELLKGKQEIVRRLLKENYSGKVSPKLLEEAVQLDMHREPMKFDDGNGVTVDAPKYIASLCTKYKIEMPK